MLLLSWLLLVSCRKQQDRAEQPSPTRCGEDFGCFVEHARTCSPATVVHRQRVLLSDGPVETAIQHEIFGPVRGRCHIARLQLVPVVPLENVSIEEDDYAALARLQPEPLASLDKLPPPLLQCLYSESQAVEVMERLRDGLSTAEDLEPCYPGDGTCDQVPAPLLWVECAPNGCLAGRWTFVCFRKDGLGRNQIHLCEEGTRVADTAAPGCAALCVEGRLELNCRETRPLNACLPIP